MSESGYLNFDLEIERAGQHYGVQVLSSPAGEARAEIESSVLTQIDSAATPQAIGEQLYEAIFRGEIGTSLRRSLDEAHRQEKGLRIRLRLAEAPELNNLPWEYLYDRSRDTFFALSSETPLVRYLDLPEPPSDLQGEPKLRVLAVIASPAGYPPLDVEREWANLKIALHDLEANGQVAIDRLTPPSIEALQRQLLRQEYHILHFLGHGTFDAEANDSVLLLQDEASHPQVVTGQDFSTLLRDHRSLRLALLNACEGAEAAVGDAYSGVAQRLVRDGIPAVIAMRTVISDKAGVALASSFYGALAEGAAVDTALAESRKALFTGGFQTEWGTPVLFMRAATGDLWRHEAAPTTPLWKKAVLATGLLAALLVLGVLVYSFIGPTRMDPQSTMNVAVTEVGAVDAQGKMQRSADGDLIRTWVVGALAAGNAASQADSRMLVWHDGLPRTQKRAKLGYLVGKTPDERAQAAEALAGRIGADVIIYGHLEPAGDASQFVQEFYVAPRLRPEANETIGRYQLGAPILVPADLAKADSLAKEAVAAQVADRSQGLFRLLLALRDDLLGRHEQALTQLEQTAGELTSWGERGEGKEILYYLLSRQALFLKRYDEAEGFATRALASNPAYPRAYVVLGGVGVRRAQELSAFQSLAEAGPLDQADAAYAKAVELATASDDRRMELIARLGMAGGHVTRGNLLFGLNTPEDDPEAARWLEQVVAETRPLLAPLEEIKQYRLLAQADSYLGIAAWRLAALAERQNDPGRARELYIQARDTLAACEEQVKRSPEDRTLAQTIVAGSCTPAKQEVLKAMSP
jgi:tetratricopeptide (TPR) repeat protein